MLLIKVKYGGGGGKFMSLYYLKNGELIHYGVKGQKWGVRRYQNKDGSLTTEGKKRLSKYIDSNGNYTQEGLKKRFDIKVERGVQNYIYNKKISDPLVRHVVNEHKHEIDIMIAKMHHKRMNDEMIVRQSIEGVRFAAREAERAANQAASLSITGGTNPFMFG